MCRARRMQAWNGEANAAALTEVQAGRRRECVASMPHAARGRVRQRLFRVPMWVDEVEPTLQYWAGVQRSDRACTSGEHL